MIIFEYIMPTLNLLFIYILMWAFFQKKKKFNMEKVR